MSDCFVLYLLLICMKKEKTGAGKFTNNNMAFTCVDGLANGNVYTVDFVADVDWDWEFSKVRTIMEKTEEGYRFISNTSMVSPE